MEDFELDTFFKLQGQFGSGARTIYPRRFKKKDIKLKFTSKTTDKKNDADNCKDVNIGNNH